MIPKAADRTIQAYLHIPVGEGKTVRCPYYRTHASGKERWGLNAFSGKGSPEEIADEVRIIEKLEKKRFAGMSPDEVRDVMRKRKLGVECSGFLAHVFDAWVRATKGKRVYEVLRLPKPGLWGRIAFFFRPFTHIDVATLTAAQNAERFLNLQEIREGDILRFPATDKVVDHGMLVTNVQDGVVEYVHSVRESVGVGVKEGRIRITTPGRPLQEQEWTETPDTGHTAKERGTPEMYHPKFL